MKYKKYITIKVFESLILTVIFTLIIFSATMNKSMIMQDSLNNEDSDSGFIQLSDEYDGEDGRMSIMNFFEQPNSLKRMKKLYYSINQNEQLKYYEISFQNLQFIGKYNGRTDFVNGGKECVNDKQADGTLLTPLKSIQISEKTSEYLNMNNKISKGHYFSQEDYVLNSNKRIPVILGNSYAGMYNVGDSFDTLYLGDMKLKCNVIGFLGKDSDINIQSTYKLDDVIVMPSLNIMNELPNDEKSFEKVLYSIKNSGYIYYSNTNNYNNNIKLIKKIIRKSNIEWNYIGKDNNPFKDNPIRVSINTIKCIQYSTWILTIIIIFIIYFFEKKIYKMTVIPKDTRERVIFQSKVYIILTLQVNIMYLISYEVVKLLIRYSGMRYFVGQVTKQMIFVPILYILVIAYIININIKKNIQH